MVMSNVEYTKLNANKYMLSTVSEKCCFILLQMNLHNLKNMYARVDEIPFSSDNKYMATVCTPKYGQVGNCFCFVKCKI